MAGYDWEDDTVRGPHDFAIHKSQASCVVDSMKTLIELTGLFRECKTTREHYGRASEGNRIEVWTIRLELRE